MRTSFNRFVAQSTHDLLMAIHDGAELGEAMLEVTLRHAERLQKLGEIGVLLLDPCPRCGGTLMGGDNVARCSAGCGFVHRARSQPEPIASRRADP